MKIPYVPVTRLARMLSFRRIHREIIELIDAGVDHHALAMALGVKQNKIERILWRAGYIRLWRVFSHDDRRSPVKPRAMNFRILPIMNGPNGKLRAQKLLGLSHRKMKHWMWNHRIKRIWTRLPLPKPEPLDYVRGAAKLREIELSREVKANAD